MSDIYKISTALEELRKYYGLKYIKHVTLDMSKDEPEITFVSNRPKQLSHIKVHDKHTIPKEIVYCLRLEIRVTSIFKGKEENEK